MQNIIQQDLVDSGVFSFYLPSNSESEGELIIGSVDKSKFTGELFWQPLSEDHGETYWKIDLDNMIINGKRVSDAPSAILDTGTSLLVGPYYEVEAIADSLGAEAVEGAFLIDCSNKDSMPEIDFVIGGKKFSIPSNYLVLGDRGLCILGIQGMHGESSLGPFWILGDVFLRHY